MGKFLAFNSTVFTQKPVIQASMPTHWGGLRLSLNCVATFSTPFGA